MDLDAYSAAHRDEWDRLDALASKRSLSGAEADELIDRYQAGATQLSAIKTTAGSPWTVDPEIGGYLGDVDWKGVGV